MASSFSESHSFRRSRTPHGLSLDGYRRSRMFARQCEETKRCGSRFTYSTRQSHQRLGRQRYGAQNFGTCSTHVSETVRPGFRVPNPSSPRLRDSRSPFTQRGRTGKELRRLHDTVQQHLCTLKAMDCTAPGSFITSVLELKLDSNTMFEWQRHDSQESSDVPHYNKLLDFIKLYAQASK